MGLGCAGHAVWAAAHLLGRRRELQALVEIEREEWARKMRRLLRRMCHAVNLAQKPGLTLKPRLIARFDRCYDAIIAEGFAFHVAQPEFVSAKAKARGRQPRRTGHNLLPRLQDRKQETLRFLHDPTVPFTNNLAERDLRMLEPRSGSRLRQKISDGFRSAQAAVDFATIRSFLSTARKREWGIIDARTQDPEHLIQRLRSA